MKYCQKCGKNVSNNVKFCQSCGAKVKHEKPQKEVIHNEDKKSYKGLLITLGIISIIIFIIFLISIFSGRTSSTQNTCDTVSAPSVHVECQKMLDGMTPCYAYPKGDSNIVYRGIGYQNNGVATEGGETLSGSFGISIGSDKYLSYVDVFPNLDGKFCENKVTRIYKKDFLMRKNN